MLDLVHAWCQTKRLGVSCQEHLGTMGTVSQTKKGQHMKWFRQWMWRAVQRAGEENSGDSDIRPARLLATRDVDDFDSERSLNIRIHRANGGTIVAFRQYDSKTDRNIHRVYVIPEDQDFEKSLGKIITIEQMRL